MENDNQNSDNPEMEYDFTNEGVGLLYRGLLMELKDEPNGWFNFTQLAKDINAYPPAFARGIVRTGDNKGVKVSNKQPGKVTTDKLKTYLGDSEIEALLVPFTSAEYLKINKYIKDRLPIDLTKEPFFKPIRSVLTDDLSKCKNFVVCLGSRFFQVTHCNVTSNWDVLSGRKIFKVKHFQNLHSDIELFKTLGEAHNDKHVPMYTEKYRELTSNKEPRVGSKVYFFLGSPLANKAVEIALAKLFKVEPFKYCADLPYYFEVDKETSHNCASILIDPNGAKTTENSVRILRLKADKDVSYQGYRYGESYSLILANKSPKNKNIFINIMGQFGATTLGAVESLVATRDVVGEIPDFGSHYFAITKSKVKYNDFAKEDDIEIDTREIDPETQVIRAGIMKKLRGNWVIEREFV